MIEQHRAELADLAELLRETLRTNDQPRLRAAVLTAAEVLEAITGADPNRNLSDRVAGVPDDVWESGNLSDYLND